MEHNNKNNYNKKTHITNNIALIRNTITTKTTNIINYITNNYLRITIMLILLVAIITSVYYLIKHYTSKRNTYIGYSYYNKNPAKFNPLFTLNTLSFDECKNTCVLNTECKGITMDYIDEKC